MIKYGNIKDSSLNKMIDSFENTFFVIWIFMSLIQESSLTLFRILSLKKYKLKKLLFLYNNKMKQNYFF